ncbi:TPA: hypothetical protein ACGO1T_000655 [Streptococcus suis]
MKNSLTQKPIELNIDSEVMTPAISQIGSKKLLIPKMWRKRLQSPEMVYCKFPYIDRIEMIAI